MTVLDPKFLHILRCFIDLFNIRINKRRCLNWLDFILTWQMLNFLSWYYWLVNLFLKKLPKYRWCFTIISLFPHLILFNSINLAFSRPSWLHFYLLLLLLCALLLLHFLFHPFFFFIFRFLHCLVFDLGPVTQVTDLVAFTAHHDDYCSQVGLSILDLHIERVRYQAYDQ